MHLTERKGRKVSVAQGQAGVLRLFSQRSSSVNKRRRDDSVACSFSVVGLAALAVRMLSRAFRRPHHIVLR